MPTTEQIRAARALIGWSQSDLAKHADLSQTGIARIENGTNQPNSQTLQKITNAFDQADVEFIGNSGVKKRTREIRELRGTEGFRALMDDVYLAANTVGGNIRIINGTPSIFLKWIGEEWYKKHAERMRGIKDSFDFKIVASQDGTNEIATGFAEYRWMDETCFYNNCVYIYCDRVAFIRFTEDDVIIEVAKRPSFAATFNLIFDYVWHSLSEKN
ncbi:MAG: helix-turn-helix domain-containing protein [Alphaproteobacteria bacterium]